MASLPTLRTMKDLLLIVAHLLATLAKLLGPGSAKAIVADSLEQGETCLFASELLLSETSRKN